MSRSIRENIVYGPSSNDGLGEYISINLYEDGLLRIRWSSDIHAVSYYFTMHDNDEYDDFMDELIAVFKDCGDIGEAYYELENYLNSGEADVFLEEHC